MRNAVNTAINEWAVCGVDKTPIRYLLTHLQRVLPSSVQWSVSDGEVHSKYEEVRKTYRRALLIVYPDKLQGKDCIELELAIGTQAFGILHDALQRWQSGRPSMRRRGESGSSTS